MIKFDNKDRNRYYGLRVGDLVQIEAGLQSAPKILNAEVIDYGFMDNNRVVLKLERGEETDWVAEWCKIITKVEDRELAR
jgi:hypothetical protein